MTESLTMAYQNSMEIMAMAGKPVSRDEMAAAGKDMAIWFKTTYEQDPAMFITAANDFLRACKGLLPFFIKEFPGVTYVLDATRTPILMLKQ